MRLAIVIFIIAAIAMAASFLLRSENGHADEVTPLPADGDYATAIFAGGCFWCMEKPFDALDGVLRTRSGYSGGNVDNPSYEQVSSGNTGHYEVVEIAYDPVRISYEDLLHVFWRNVDPLDATGQFCDKGQQYMSAIFYTDEDERLAAETTRDSLQERFDQSIATRILPSGAFYAAEDYHQDYYLKNPIRYNFYRSACGRDARLDAVWGDEAGGH